MKINRNNRLPARHQKICVWLLTALLGACVLIKLYPIEPVLISECAAAEYESTADEFDLSQVPAYKDSPGTVINYNVPYFTSADLSDNSYIELSPLDSFGRCGTALACVGPELLPAQPRGEIGPVKPTGWHTVKYQGIDHDFLYNRCHLLAYALTGENADERNLITGTRYMNVEGMLPYEKKVIHYVEATGNHVMYRVTPEFNDDNLLADGVLMEAYSVEDQGAGVEFCVFVYNVQPGITIDYATGQSSGPAYTGDETSGYDGVDFTSPGVIEEVQEALNQAGYDCGSADGMAGSRTQTAIENFRKDAGISGSGMDAALALALGLNARDLLDKSIQTIQPEQPDRQDVSQDASQERSWEQEQKSIPEVSADSSEDGGGSSGEAVTYVVNTNTGKFHYPGCSSADDIKPHNRMDFSGSREELIEMGYQPCKRCNP